MSNLEMRKRISKIQSTEEEEEDNFEGGASFASKALSGAKKVNKSLRKSKIISKSLGVASKLHPGLKYSKKVAKAIGYGHSDDDYSDEESEDGSESSITGGARRRPGRPRKRAISRGRSVSRSRSRGRSVSRSRSRGRSASRSRGGSETSQSPVRRRVASTVRSRVKSRSVSRGRSASPVSGGARKHSYKEKNKKPEIKHTLKFYREKYYEDRGYNPSQIQKKIDFDKHHVKNGEPKQRNPWTEFINKKTGGSYIKELGYTNKYGKFVVTGEETKYNTRLSDAVHKYGSAPEAMKRLAEEYRGTPKTKAKLNVRGKSPVTRPSVRLRS